MLRVGLTGGIACGKSRVRRHLAAAGLGTLDLDAVGHDVIAPGGAAYDEVVAAFGRDILAPDGRIDRKALGARVFADAAARAQLNALVHPRVRDEEARRAAAFEASGGQVFVTDAALLVEAGLHLRFDRLVVVDCEGHEQLRRLVARDALDEEAARRRIAAQMLAAEKRRFAHIVLDASGTLEATDAVAATLAADLTALAARPPSRPRVREESVLGALAAGPQRGPGRLDPARFLVAVAAFGGAEMERLKGLLEPPFGGPWYAAGYARSDGEPGAEALALVVGLWSLARRGLDDAFTAGAMFSIARLTDARADRTAAACLIAVAAAHLAAGERPADRDRASWVAQAEKWSGTAVPEWAQAVVHAAVEDARQAGAAAAAAGVDPRLAAGLLAAIAGDSGTALPEEVREAARALITAAGRR